MPEVVNVVPKSPRSTTILSNVGAEPTEPPSTYHSLNPKNPAKTMPILNNKPIISFGILRGLS